MSVSQSLPNVTIGYSRGRLLALFAACLLLTLICAWLAFSWQQGKGVTTFELAACYIGAVFFGLATCRMLLRLTTAREPVVFISRVGIRDTRLADETIAWSAVRKIHIWEQRMQKFVVLKVDPLVAERFAAGFLTRALMSKAFAADSVVVNAGGLTREVGALLEICKHYWGAGRPAHLDDAVPSPEAELEPQPVG
jgi:hypothetical protein